MTIMLKKNLNDIKNKSVFTVAFSLLVGLLWIRRILWTYVWQVLTYVPIVRLFIP